ncbi:MAG: efflux RND transporter periplasmic adaptor subunit [Eudoraea sp.]|nr:efflux RND transporter periplasmic adaptor subunit [Eudoraea sp.]NNJ40826.1 efflux RND transporter periplasmic adaptor subunit [Eudoraea sp.]
MILVKKYAALFLSLMLFVNCKEKGTTTETGMPEGTIEIVENGIRIRADQFKSSGMALGFADTIMVREEVNTQGYIDVPPENRAVISAPMPGFIKHAPLIVGDKVRKGQRVIVLENPDFVALQQEFLEAAAQQDYLRAEYERQKTLFAEQVTSRKNYMKAESEYRKNDAKISSLKAQLGLLRVDTDRLLAEGIRPNLNLIAPIAGSITDVKVSLGMYTPPNQALLEIINTEHLHLELGIFEGDAIKIKIGQPIHFYLPENPGQVFDGEVYKVGNLVEMESRTLRVHGHIPASLAEKFAIGMYVQAVIEVAEKEAVVLPDEAVIREGEGAFALVLWEQTEDEFHFKKIPIDLGISQDGYSQIISPDPELLKRQFLTGGTYWFRTEAD